MLRLTKILLFTIAILTISISVHAQVSPKIIGERYAEYEDSIRNVDYPFVLPLLGDKARERGVDLQKPLGIMVNFYTQRQDLSLSNLAVSMRDDQDLINIDEFTEFESITTRNNVITIRPDVWILPFLNVYLIASRFYAHTDAILAEPLELDIPPVEKVGYGGGFGTVLAYGWGPVWGTYNFNMAWSKAPGIDKPTQSYIHAIRVGTTYHTRNRKRSGSVWVGGAYQDYLGSNTGSYDMTQLIPDEKPRLEELKVKIEEVQAEWQEKYGEYCSQPGNIVQCNIMDQVLEEFKGRVEDKIGGLEPPALNINFGYEVSPAKKWNLVTGMQLNINRSWEARFEAGLLGRRNFLLSVNYRFGIFRKKNAHPVGI